MKLNKEADPLQVAEALRSAGITVGQRLEDGRVVVFINRRKWLCMQYPELIPIYEDDRMFWKSVRKRTRNGEEVSKEEIEAHAKEFNERFNKVMEKYEK